MSKQSDEEVREAILSGFRASFRLSEGSDQNRAEYVAERVGISLRTLYNRINALGLKDEIVKLREGAGVSRSGHKPGAQYTCGTCGVKGHNSRKCPKGVL